MQRIRSMFVSALFVAVILLTNFFLKPGFAKEGNGSSGHVHFVSPTSMFYQRGGDTTTQGAGTVYFKQTMFDNLIHADVNQNEIPALAKSWKIGPNWSYVDFFLRNDVKFHNGALVTAEDIKYSIDAHRDSKYWILGHAFRRYVKDVEIVSPDHIRINMNSPFWGLLGRLWWGTGIFPKEYREKVGPKEFANAPIGAGPFKWAGDWKQDGYFTLEAVEDHYRYPPEFKTMKISFVFEPTTRMAILKSGEGDIVGLSSFQRPEIQNDSNLRLLTNYHTSGSGLVYLDLAFPNDPSPFHDERVRDAVSMAIDRDTICNKVMFYAAKPWGSVLTPITLGFDSREIIADPYDPERAKKLLAEAGYPDGFETTFHITPTQQYYAEAICSNLADVGIKAKLEVWEYGAQYMAFKERKLHGLNVRISWYNAERHSSLYDGFLSTGFQVYHGTPEIDAAIDEADRVISDEDRIEANRRLEKVIKKAKLRANLWSWSESWGLGPKIESWEFKQGEAPTSSLETIKLKR